MYVCVYLAEWYLQQVYMKVYCAIHKHMGFLGNSVVKNPPAKAGDVGSIPGSGRSLENMATHSCVFPGESHGQRSLAGYSPEGCKESDTT